MGFHLPSITEGGAINRQRLDLIRAINENDSELPPGTLNVKDWQARVLTTTDDELRCRINRMKLARILFE